MRLRWKLYLSYVGLVLTTALLVGVLASRWLEQDARQRVEGELRAHAQLLRGLAESELKPAALQLQLTRIGRGLGVRLTLVAADGRVTGDSEEAPALMDNHARRPELLACQAAPQGVSVTRFSETLNKRMVYLALPIGPHDAPTGFARAALPLTDVETALAALHQNVAAGALLAVVLALVPGFWLARRLTQRVESMTARAHAISTGDYEGTPQASQALDELGGLSRALERMATQLQTRMQTVEDGRRELLAILSSMVEGVLAVGPDERILHVNLVARQLLGTESGELLGQTVEDRIPVPEVQQTLRDTIQGQEPEPREVVLRRPTGDRVVSLHASLLRDEGGLVAGAVLVLHDLTELRKLETMRTDFVANVSHELKTPLTAISGLLETVLDDEGMPTETRVRFLEKSKAQTARLTSLVQDLLTLSRVEAGGGPLELAPVDLVEPARASFVSLAPSAREKGLNLSAEWPTTTVPVEGDRESLRQLVDNLLDNAIKYTPEGQSIQLRVFRWGREAVLEVQDTGIGLGSGDAQRIFERFYRVDKARSRQLGGTGLGLSIVKHIALAHGGHVSVQSRPGEGSCFRASLPLCGQPPQPL